MSRTEVPSRRTVLQLGLALGLTACGGGGGGGGSDTPTTTTPDTPTGSVTPDPPVNGPAWPGFGRDAQHTAVSGIASQDLNRIAWSAAVDLQPQYRANGSLAVHYGSPVVTTRNTIAMAVKTGANSGFRVEARSGLSGTLLWSQDIDYAVPPHDWFPSCNLLLTPGGRLLAPGAGGRLLARDNPDTAGSSFNAMVFYGASAYASASAAYDATVFINTPLVSDAQGNVFFGFVVTGSNPAGLASGIARIGADGQGRWVGAAAAANDPAIVKPAMNSAPALSPDGGTLYVAVNQNAVSGTTQTGYLLALDSTTLATRARATLNDPLASAGARISDNGTSSPCVGPDGRVYFGVLERTFGTHNARGWLLQFDANLQPAGVPGSFGWDVTPSVIPASMVPSYTGTSTYLLAVKYNNYSGVGTGDGLNRLAVLDPRATQADAFSTVTVMREVLTIVAPTRVSPSSPPVWEWCINTMAADVARRAMLVNNEDGILYRWDLATNTLAQSIRLTGGLGQAYTPTLVGADGAVYAISNARLYSVRS
ncbi:hypothetical protein [Ramlibacter albus]|uniref:Uncharacterized protein n=1 Tax=Ramlibacter albus TaxID=2079448 RepID=A0A923S269_9BURK|nr:hypothetical protein [Ramlibacter albus]MBC5765169.1 hypothetical protein [Ramlibacter albus]